MAALRDVVGYLCLIYPRQFDLSKARVTKMVYLCDWRSCLLRGEPLTSIQWMFHHYGPWVEDVRRLAAQDPHFRLVEDTNPFGRPMERIKVVREPSLETLAFEDRQIVSGIVELCHPLCWNDFIALVYRTYPIRVRDRYSQLDLVALADQYKSRRRGDVNLALH